MSVIDYGIVNETFWKEILTFKVHPLVQYSDHCPVSMKLAANYKLTNKKVKNKSKTGNLRNITSFVWSHNSVEDFKHALCQQEVKEKLETFLNSQCNSVSEEVDCFNNILYDIGRLSLKL